MGFFDSIRTNFEIWTLERQLETDRKRTLLELYQKENVVLERISSDFRGLGTSLRFNTSLSGADSDQDTEKDLTNSAVLQERILLSRVLVRENPFARSAITNMQHYIIGADGMRFHLNDPSKKSAANKVLEVWNRWCEYHDFVGYQHEVVRRVMRDGAVYTRWSENAEFRMVEPTEIKGAPGAQTEIEQKWGILTDPDDVTIRESYSVDIGNGNFETIPAEEIDYLNWKDADKNVLRPSPVLYDFLEFLEGAASVLRNMRELVRVQTAIALIREHPEGRAGHQIAQWATAQADTVVNDTDSGKDVRQKKWRPGTVIDSERGAKIHFPAAQMNVDRMVGALSADLRAVAAALGLPEFIFTADAGRSNYASLMAAEGPAVKTFISFQGWLGRYYLMAFRRVMLAASTGGISIPDPMTGDEVVYTVPPKVTKMLVNVQGPSVKHRDQFGEARTAAIYAGLGVISPQSIAGQIGLDYAEQQRLIDEHNTNYGERPWPPTKNGDEPTDQETGSEKRNAGGAEQ